MKKILMATAFAALIASPAFAQEGSHKQSHATRTSHAAAQAARHGRTEGGAAVNANGDVYSVAPYFSADPDPVVRQQMIIDGTTGN
jgi:hypothetical protein